MAYDTRSTGNRAKLAMLDKLDDIRARKKEEEIIAFAATWADLETVTLSAAIRHHVVSPITWNLQK